MSKRITKILILLSSFILLAVIAVGQSCSAPTAYAVVMSENNFDNTRVEDDLADLDLQYVKDNYSDVSIVELAEYCYSDNVFKQGNYGLYIYVYNPDRITFSVQPGANVVNMAVGYNDDGEPNAYENMPLIYLGKTTGENEELFYKFRIDGASELIPVVKEYSKTYGERRYDIAGVQLRTLGSDTATDYGIGGTWHYTGYAKGYGEDENAESTLDCTVTELETVELDVKHTFYRTETSSKGAGYQNQLDTVYFAVPDRFFEAYGGLQRIKAEWYEYKTKDIIVTSNTDLYNRIYPYISKTPDREYDERIGISLGQDATTNAGAGLANAKWGWNLGTGYVHPIEEALYYLFLVEDIEEYDPYADIVSIGGVESNALYSYILNYDKTYESGTLPIKNGSISADLFDEDIDDYRKVDNENGKIQHGYSYYDFDADVDLQTMVSWKESDPSFWDNWVNYGFWNALFGNIPEESGRTVSPIYTVKAEDLEGSDAEVSERLLVHTSDVEALREFYDDAVTVDGADDEPKTVVLFRFATTDYYSASVDIIELGAGILGSDKHTGGQVYRAWESVFFDFDIIQLTFDRDGVYTVIPAVADPVDIVNAVTPPTIITGTGLAWWQILLIVVGVVLGLYIIIKIVIRIVKSRKNGTSKGRTTKPKRMRSAKYRPKNVKAKTYRYRRAKTSGVKVRSPGSRSKK